MRLRLIRHATLERRATPGRRAARRPDARPGEARAAPVENTPNRASQPARGAARAAPRRSSRGRRGARHPPARRTTSTTPRSAAVAGPPPSLPSPRDAETLRRARLHATPGRRGRRSTRTASTSPAPATSTARRGRAACSRPSPASSSADDLYIAGDTIWCDEVRARASTTHGPDVIVVNASGARFIEGDPLVMTVDDVAAVARHAPGAHVVAVHLEAINHCPEHAQPPCAPSPVSVPTTRSGAATESFPDQTYTRATVWDPTPAARPTCGSNTATTSSAADWRT